MLRGPADGDDVLTAETATREGSAGAVRNCGGGSVRRRMQPKCCVDGSVYRELQGARYRRALRTRHLPQAREVPHASNKDVLGRFRLASPAALRAEGSRRVRSELSYLCARCGSRRAH